MASPEVGLLWAAPAWPHLWAYNVMCNIHLGIGQLLAAFLCEFASPFLSGLGARMCVSRALDELRSTIPWIHASSGAPSSATGHGLPRPAERDNKARFAQRWLNRRAEIDHEPSSGNHRDTYAFLLSAQRLLPDQSLLAKPRKKKIPTPKGVRRRHEQLVR